MALSLALKSTLLDLSFVLPYRNNDIRGRTSIVLLSMPVMDWMYVSLCLKPSDI